MAGTRPAMTIDANSALQKLPIRMPMGTALAIPATTQADITRRRRSFNAYEASAHHDGAISVGCPAAKE